MGYFWEAVGGIALILLLLLLLYVAARVVSSAYFRSRQEFLQIQKRWDGKDRRRAPEGEMENGENAT